MKFFALLLVSLTVPVSALLHAQEQRSVDAHVHGVAELNVLQEGNRVLIEFLSPAVNIIGFEHAPEDDTQAMQLGNALQQLEATDSILMLSDLDCEVLASQSGMTGVFAAQTSGEVSEHDHDHDEHGHEHEESEGGHAGFEASFELDCRSEATLSELTVTAFASFAGIETLQMQWVLNRLQGAQRLGRDSSKVVEIGR